MKKYRVCFSLCEMLMLISIRKSEVLLAGNLQLLGAGIGSLAFRKKSWI